MSSIHRQQRGKTRVSKIAEHAMLTSRHQFIGGYKGDWRNVPSGQNCEKKLKMLAEEGVMFDDQGMLVDEARWWDDFKM